MSDERTELEIVAVVENAFAPGHNPIAVYTSLDAVNRLSQTIGAALTTRMLNNLAARICDIERELGMDG